MKNIFQGDNKVDPAKRVLKETELRAKLGETTPDKSTFWWAGRKGHAGVNVNKRTQGLFGVEVTKPSIRSGSLDTLHECPRKFLFRYRLSLSPRNYREALTIGKMYHKIKAHIYAGATEQEAIFAADQHRQDYLKELGLLCDDAGMLPWGQPFADIGTKSQKDYAVGKALALWTNAYAPAEDHWEVVGSEQMVEFKFSTIARPIRLRLDALLRHKKSGLYYIQDHKTCSGDPRLRMETCQFEIQTRIYRLGASNWLAEQGIDPTLLRGFLHDVVSKPTIRQKQKETFTEYLQRIDTTYTEKQAAHRTNPDNEPVFMRSCVDFNTPLMDDELLFQLREASLASSAWVRLDTFERRANSCRNYNSVCPFLKLCNTNPAMWPAEIAGKFTVITRDQQDLLEH